MMRPLHRFTGLILGLFLSVVALSGAALSVWPAMERLSAGLLTMTAAQLVSTVTTATPGVQEIAVSPSGTVTAYTSDGAQVVDPGTGAAKPATTSAALTWLTNLHRQLFLGDQGRVAVAVAALAMLGLSASGLALLARGSGGCRGVFAGQKGSRWARFHAETAWGVVLALSTVTGLWMTAATFNLVPTAESPAFPDTTSGLTGATLPLDFPAGRLRDLTFPQDARDVCTLTTTEGSGYVDQGTGKVLNWVQPTWADRVTATAQMLRTGRGAAVLGLILGPGALSVPLLGLTGALMRGLSRRKRFTPAGQADTVILVGSEGGSTWSFAQTLAEELTAKGARPHLAPLSDFGADFPQAQAMMILTATYGDGEAPASAAGFLAKLEALPEAPQIPLAILGFGDRSFPRFCALAEDIAAAAQAKGWPRFAPMATVDRQSAQDFAPWGTRLGAALGRPLVLAHEATISATETLTLIARRDHGQDIQAPAAILRLALPRRGIWARLTGRGDFQAGDLLGILPQGSNVPRFYSLASGRRDGFVEICIRRHEGGLCSSQSHGLEPGEQVRAFLRLNPAFHAPETRAPLILIGAGTGIGPLAGMIRGARPSESGCRGPVHLFFGMRHEASDFYSAEDLAEWQAQRRLTGLNLAFSRGRRSHCVQDALRAQGAQLRDLVGQGARIMVCGGREMGQGVRATLTEILTPIGLSPDHLAKEGCCAEDVY